MEKTLKEIDGEFSIEAQAHAFLADANGYIKVLERHLSIPSRFDTKLLHNIANISFEKLFVALLAYYGIEALNHMPMALFIEAKKTDANLTDSMQKTAKSLQKHESICTLESTGYTVPDETQLRDIIGGLIEIRDYVKARISDN